MADRPLLPVADDDLVACVACGLCLPHCPTYRVTGDEMASPRGRIAAMRAVQSGSVAPDDAFVESMHSCVQCRGCETACPSGVPFGRLMEGARHALSDGVAGARGRTPWWLRAGVRALGHPVLLRSGVIAAAVAQRLGVRVPGLPPRLPLRRGRLRSTGSDVTLFTGCVMDQWDRHVHRAAVALLGAIGVGVQVRGGACCGALAAHAGEASTARRQAAKVLKQYRGDEAVLVDSAGCGAALLAYAETAGEEGRRFAGRVVDVHTWLAARLDELPTGVRALPPVAVQDPCHLRHVQRAHLAVRDVLAPYAPVVELDDEGLCCGAGGAYATLQPGLATAIRARKLEAIARSGTALVASANPGCAAHLRASGVRAVHPLVLAAYGAGLVDELEG